MNTDEYQKLVDMKSQIADLHNLILGLSQGLWQISSDIDVILMGSMKSADLADDRLDTPYMKSIKQVDEEVEQELKQNDMPPIPKRGRPRKERTPEPVESPTSDDVPFSLPPLPPEPTQPEIAPKQSLIGKLLGKDADLKAKQRAERMAQLERELAELNKR